MVPRKGTFLYIGMPRVVSVLTVVMVLTVVRVLRV